MDDRRKTKAQLISELEQLRNRLSEDDLAAPTRNQVEKTPEPILERIDAERSLPGRANGFQNIIDAAQEGIWIVDAAAITTFVNDQLALMLGYSVDEMLRRPVFDFIHQRDRQEAQRYLDRGKQGIKEQHDFKFRRKDGSSVWAMISTTPLFDETGNFAGGLAMVMDVSDRKRAELALRESEANFRALAETAAAAIFIYRGLKLVYVNPTTEEHTGYSREELLKKPFLEVVHPEFRDLLKERALARQRGEQVPNRYEFKILTKSGETRWVDATASSIEYEGLPATIGTAFDITDRKRAEEALSESEAKFRVLAETAESGIFIYQDSKLVYLNPFAVAMTGYSEQEQLSMDFWEVIHPDHRDMVKKRGLARLRGGSAPSRYELKLLTKSGEERWLDFSASAIEFQGKRSVLGTALDITERKRAEEALHRTQDRLQHVLSCSPAVIYMLRIQGKRFTVEWMSDSLTGVTGYEMSEALADEWWIDHLHPGDRERALASLRVVLTKDRLALEYRFEHKGGGYLWVHDELRVLRDESGKPLEVIGSWTDVTERREAERALRDSEERYRDLVENARDIIYTHDLEGNYTSVNKAVEQITGYSREEALTMNFAQTVAPEFVEKAQQMLAAKLVGQGETVYDLDLIAKDGRRITVEVNTRLVLHGNVPIGIQGIARDVTERKRAEDALSASRGHLQAILDNCPAMIFQKDLAGRYLQVNRQFERTSSLTAEQVLGRTDEELFTPQRAAAFRASDRSVLDAGRPVEFEESVVDADGRHTYIVQKFPLLDAAGNIYAVGGISTDITPRKRAESDLRKQKEILESIFNHAPIMIGFFGADGQPKLLNQEWERWRGWTLPEIDAQNVDLLAEGYPDTQYRRQVLDFFATSNGEWADLKTKVRDGRVVEATWAVVHLSDGTSIGIGQDITERKRAGDLLRRQTAQLAALHEIELEISAERELSRVLDVVTRRAAELLNAGHGSTYILNREDAAELRLVASLEPDLIGARLRLGEGLAGQVAVTGCALAIEDYSTWENRASIFEGKRFGPTLSAPLKWQRTVIGVINLSRNQGEEVFTEDDSYFLEQIAAEAAIAIHQATLFEEVQEGHKRQRVLSHKLLAVQEAERKRLACELHDQIGQALTAVQISLHRLESSRDGGFADILADSLAVIDEALQQVHDLSLDLRPSLLDDLGLVAALRWYVDRLAKRAGLERSFDADGLAMRLGPELETACFRIAQEALTNVLRHANARTVWMRVGQRGDDLKLEVRDDGVGFDVRTAMNRRGTNASLGLQGMQERALAVGGHVVIKSQQGTGTKVEAIFRLDGARQS
jgi:PAS domain S-box-containing protein